MTVDEFKALLKPVTDLVSSGAVDAGLGDRALDASLVAVGDA